MFRRPLRDVLRGALWLVAAGYLLFIGWTQYQGYAAAAGGGTPLYTDFTSLYAGARQAQQGPAADLYIPQARYEAMVETARTLHGAALPRERAQVVGFAPWMHPPVFILFALPLAFLPYLPALAAWLGVTLIPYLAALGRILPPSLALPFGLAAPPAFFNMMYGQTGFLSAGLIALGLTLLRSRPTLAGILIGLACFKPHLGVLIPLALVAGGLWQPFGVATITVVGLVTASILLLGADPWYGYIGTFEFYLEGFGAGAYAWHALTSVLGTVRLLGGGMETAWHFQYLVSALVATTVVWAWRDARGQAHVQGLAAALLCIGTPLVVPMAYLYDLVLVVPGAAWVWADLRSRGAHPWEWATLVAGLAPLLVAKTVAEVAAFPLGALCVALLFCLALYRFLRRDGAAAGLEGGPSPGNPG